MTVNEATWQFVDGHLKDDVRQLALKKSKYKDIDFEFALQQIQGRQKTRDKLPCFGSIPRFVFPPSLALEQCSSEITAKYKRFIINDILCRDARTCVSTGNAPEMFCRDARPCVSTGIHRSFADLTGGFGIDTLFLSDLFETCHYVEPQQQLCDILSHNLELLRKNNVRVHQDTMEHFIEEMDVVDLIYLDPSRRNTFGQKMVGMEECVPNVLVYKDMLLKKSERVLLKLSPMLDIKRSLAQLPDTSEVYVLAVNGECKELLFLLEKNACAPVRYHAVNIMHQQAVSFVFAVDEEEDALPEFAAKAETYLYEPNAAILKAGSFKCIANRFNVKKLHPHSHLYTSDVLIQDFPGRVFQVRETLPYNEARKTWKDLRKANVTVRNFPLTADQLKKNLKLADGGDVYIFATTLENGQRVLMACRKEVNTNS